MSKYQRIKHREAKALTLVVEYVCPVTENVAVIQFGYYDISSILGYYDSVDDYEITIKECPECNNFHDISTQGLMVK